MKTGRKDWLGMVGVVGHGGGGRRQITGRKARKGEREGKEERGVL